MNLKTVVCSIAIASLGFNSLSFAQPSHREDRHDARDARHDARDARHEGRDARHDAREARRDLREAQERRREAREDRREAREDRRFYNARGSEFRRGGHLPHELRDRHYVVSDWRRHRLTPPPRGYQWVQVGPDYVLVAVATGIIATLILNQ